MNEIDLIKNKRGKWSQLNIPHKGWYCVDIEDSGTLSNTCEMCESQQIRFIHYMEHASYLGTLAVGCFCAGHMEENLTTAKRRDDFMKSRASKKKRWISRNWKISNKGNEYIKTDGYVVTVFKKGDLWKSRVSSFDNLHTFYSKKNYKTSDEVKIGSFDFITKLLSEKAQPQS